MKPKKNEITKLFTLSHYFFGHNTVEFYSTVTESNLNPFPVMPFSINIDWEVEGGKSSL